MQKVSLTILCYHGVINNFPDGYNSSGKHILAEDFEKQISFLKNSFEIVTMSDVENFARGVSDLPSECVAITFDDGYENNLLVAHPILEKYEVPATLYVATRFISSNFLIWTDELERIIVGNSFTMPKKLQLSAEVLIDFSSSKSKMLSLKSAKKFLKTLPPKERDFLINDLAARLHGKHDLYQNSQLHDFLDWEQVRFLKNSTLWEIGAHTLSHNSLGTLSKFDGEMEILESMQQVCGEVGVTFPPLFAYPEGQNFDIPIYAVDILQGSGLSTAPSAISGTNQLPFDSRDGFYRLRRYLVGFENIEFPWQL